jgi:lipid-A-disaccharide synthase
VAELRRGGGAWRVEGFGGPRMDAAGVRLHAGLDRLAVMGVAEVARRAAWFWRFRRRVAEGWRRDPPDAVLFVDYPGLNLRLASDARRLGLRAAYYVTPTVWAWHESRIEVLRRLDERLVILPFEERFYAARGIPVRYVGHPLGREAAAPRDRRAFLESAGLDPGADLLGLLPGSRPQELEALARTFLDAGRRVRAAAARPVQLAFAAATQAMGERLRAIVADAAPVVTGRTADLIAASTAVLTKAGTATVEAALLGTPMVVAYRMHPLSFWLARRLVKVEHAAMVNLLAGRRVAPELLGRDATPAALAERVLPLLDPESAERREMLGAFDGIRRELVARDAPAEVAEALRRLATAGAAAAASASGAP